VLEIGCHVARRHEDHPPGTEQGRTYAISDCVRSGLGVCGLVSAPQAVADVERLAALVPPPRAHLTRCHGVFAPRSRWRGHVVPKKRAAEAEGKPVRGPGFMSWMQRPKRVFAIDIETCRGCGGRLCLIACIEEPQLIERNLRCVERRSATGGFVRRGPWRRISG